VADAGGITGVARDTAADGGTATDPMPDFLFAKYLGNLYRAKGASDAEAAAAGQGGSLSTSTRLTMNLLLLLLLLRGDHREQALDRR
jgi:hypothetical protein